MLEFQVSDESLPLVKNGLNEEYINGRIHTDVVSACYCGLLLNSLI